MMRTHTKRGRIRSQAPHSARWQVQFRKSISPKHHANAAVNLKANASTPDQWFLIWVPTQSPRESPQGLDVCKTRARRVSGANQLGGGLDSSEEVPEGRAANGVAVSQSPRGLGGGLDNSEEVPEGRAANGVAASQPIQWSSETHDTELALVYYKTADGCKAGWTCAKHAPRRGETTSECRRINYRYYNPQDGRWIRRDPARYKRSINLLAYVNNQVAERWDVLGLFFSQNQDESLGIYRKPISVYISATGSRSLATSTPHGSIQSLQDTIARKVKKCECIKNLQLLIHGNPTGMVVKGRDNKEESEWITSDTVASVFSALKDSNGRSLFCPLCTIYLDSCHVGLGVIPSIIASTTGCIVRAPYGYSCGIPRFPEWSRAKAKPGKKPLLHEDLAPEEKQNHYGYFYPDGSESPGH